MKFQITRIGNNEVRIVEAKSAYAAMKKISGNMATISKCPSLTAKYGAPVFSKGWEGRIMRNRYTVTAVIEANVPVIMMPIGW
jgi:hypothetical protein